MDVVMWQFTSKWADWERDGFATRSAVIARALASHPEVGRLLVVDAPSSIFASRNHVAENPGDVRDSAPGFSLRSIDDDVHVIEHVRLLPRERHHTVSYLVNSQLHDSALVSFVNSCQRDLGMKDPVLWFTGPLGMHLAPQLGAGPVVYDAVDDWSAHPAFRSISTALARETAAVRANADIVFAVSPPLARAFSGGHARVVLSPNGADAARFRGQHETPPDLVGLRRPIIGYVGALHGRFDHEMLAQVAARMPTSTFVLVGRLGPQMPEAPSNVLRLGFRPASVVPNYIAAFDACIVPHLEDDLTRSMDPMKVYEFLAAGKSVVGSRIRSLERFGSLVQLADSADEFVSALNAAAEGAWRPDPDELAAFVDASSWGQRIDEMVSVINMKRAG